ncbi:MAG TPA: choice-of-anchor J domain-containing protein [Bacteroidales bacterium]|nr:choice-of-anchor J domain-containing protein [Bacteroidales bacterium]
MKVITKLMYVCLILALSCTGAFSQTVKGKGSQARSGLAGSVVSKADVSATMGFINSLGGTKAMFDLLFEFPVSDAGTAGVETDGQYFYVTRWNTNLFYKYNLTGTLVDSFSVTGAGQIRDLAYDGTYFYGGSTSNTIYKMDFTSHTLVGTITCPSSVAVRHIAYDPVNNAFWCGNWDTDFTLVNMSGAVINTIPATTHLQADIYGSAYDNYSLGGPYLWVYRQTSANANDLEQINLATGVSTGVTFDVTTAVTGLTSSNSAGGLCISSDVVPNTAVLIGVAQNAKLWGLELKDIQVFANDMGVTSLVAPLSSDTLTNADSLKIVVRNFDTVAHTNIPVNYVIDGGAVVRDTLFATVAANATMNFTFSQPYNFSIPGHVYDVMIYTSIQNDGNNANDTLHTTLTNQWDVAPVSIDMPAVVGVGLNTPKATVINNGTLATTFNVTMHFTGYTSTKTVTNLMPGVTQQVTFDGWTAALGNYTIEVYTSLLADSVHSNDTLTQAIDVQNLVKVFAYVAYDPAPTGDLPQGPALTYLQTPQNVISLADQTSENFIQSGTWGPLNKWYGAVYDDNVLVSVDTLTGARTVIGNIGVSLEGLTYDPVTANLFGVSFDGAGSNLFRINAGSGNATYIGPCANQLFINLACTQAGNLYAVSMDNDSLYAIDKTTGAATPVGDVGFDVMYAQDMEVDQNTGVCYMAAYNNDIEAGELRIVDLATGSTTLIGPFLHDMEVSGFAIPFNCIAPSWDASVIAVDNLESSCDPGTVNLQIRVMNFGSSTITSLPVAYTVNGGTPVQATITTPINSGQTIPYTFTVPVDLSADGTYVVKVYSSLASDAVHSNDTVVSTVTNMAPKTIPYTLGFEPAEDLQGLSVIDNNNDGSAWFLSASGGNTSPSCMKYVYNTSSAADDWFITTCIDLEASKSYNLKYYYKAQSASYPEKLKVFVGSDNTVAAMTTQIDNKSNIINTTFSQSNVVFTVPATGTYYLGWQCYSAADMYNLYVDDISITDVTGVEENTVAIELTIMPNPANEQFTVITSENESVMTITNSLGAVVYSQKINDRMVSVNTSELCQGLYFVKIDTDKGSVIRKVVISK